MKKQKLLQVKIGIPPSLRDKLSHKAQHDVRTFSDTVRTILEEYVEKNKKEINKIVETNLLV